MSKSIEVSLKWSPQLALEASHLYYKYDMHHSGKRYVGWLFVGLTQFAIVGALKHDSYGLLYLSTFLVLYWYYGRWYLRKMMLKRYYSNKKTAKTVLFRVDDRGLNDGERVLEWEQFLKFVELPEGILLQSADDILYFQSDVFSSESDRTAFVAFAKKKGLL